MMQTISQVTLCLMLVITTTWCIIVYRKLVTIKTEGGPIKDLIQALNEASKRADQTILAMRLVIKEADTRLSALGERERSLSTASPRDSHEQPIEDHRRNAVLAAAAKQARADAAAISAADDARVRMDALEFADNELQPAPMEPLAGPTFASQERTGRKRRYEDVLRVHRATDADMTEYPAPGRGVPQVSSQPQTRRVVEAGRQASVSASASADELERLVQSIASLR